MNNEDLDNIINDFIKFLKVTNENLTDSQKIAILRNVKIYYEADFDLFSNPENDEEKNKENYARLEADLQIIQELSICINYLKARKRENSFLRGLLKK